ncbi:unnamed protein product [Lasius platythorax]|uniref:Uncharacterized protein n=1 Tax=Lasius platythorax TaxID=488582 RepID=A0AAV2NLX8_9HYME
MVNIVGIIHDKSIVRSRVANRIALYRFHCNNLRRQSKSHAITHGTRSQMTREAEEEGRGQKGGLSKCELRHCHEADTSGYRGLGLAINNLSPNEEETKRWSTERGVPGMWLRGKKRIRYATRTRARRPFTNITISTT